ncbi:MAG: NADH:flavin oxidoreductase [Muribaculaceae bacterium]|nr:NADH:flavin oxidoreductase [Muribaculaceae bacterium]MDE6755327.1 NADH:flavin oxidoreductase [Muribaculaceae bacterium]
MSAANKFSSFVVNGHPVKNRFIRSATNSHLDNTDGTISEAEIQMYEALGKGDVGTIITGHFSVSPDLKYRADIAQPSIGNDEALPGLTRVAETIHKYGATAIAQISLAGPKGLTPFDFNELSTDEMKKIGDWFVEGALRAKRAGFDGVQVHVAHWYLLQAVVNRDLNHRTDCYGGSDENLIRLPKEIVENIRRQCGEDFLIYVKMNAHNTSDGIDDYPLLAYYADTLVSSGVNLVEISGSDFTRQTRQAECYYLDAVRYLRNRFPEMVLSLVGGIYSEDSIDKVLQTTDFVSLSRTLLTQPDFIIKLKNGEATKSRCIHCNKCFEIFATKYERCVFGPVIPKLEETFRQ